MDMIYWENKIHVLGGFYMNKRKRLLIVDDSKMNRVILNEIFSPLYDIDEAENGQLALDILMADPSEFSIILTDIIMPVMDGLELLEKVKENSKLRNIPVLVITALGEKECGKQALDLGAVDLVLRPFEAALIERRVSNILHMTEIPIFRNVMEELAIKEIEKCIQSLGVCDCETCKNDLITLTLNRLKPKYVNSEKGELMSKINTLSSSSNIEIISTIACAAEIVKKNPRHNKDFLTNMQK